MKKTTKIVLLVVSVLVVIVVVVIVFYSGSDSRYLNPIFCQKDSDCTENCGDSVNKYYNKIHPIGMFESCPQVIIFNSYCENNECQSVFSKADPHYKE